MFILQVFKQKLTDLTGCEIIVISDGRDGSSEIDTAVQQAASDGVTIHSISISQKADERMISMAKLTGGIHISYLGQETTSFASLFMETISSGITETSSITVCCLTYQLLFIIIYICLLAILIFYSEAHLY